MIKKIWLLFLHYCIYFPSLNNQLFGDWWWVCSSQWPVRLADKHRAGDSAVLTWKKFVQITFIITEHFLASFRPLLYWRDRLTRWIFVWRLLVVEEIKFLLVSMKWLTSVKKITLYFILTNKIPAENRLRAFKTSSKILLRCTVRRLLPASNEGEGSFWDN